MFFIIWKGRGLNILIIPILAFILPIFIVLQTKTTALGPWSIPLGILLAVGGSWWCAHSVCKPRDCAFIDPATGRQVIIRETHSVYGIPALGCAYILTVLGGVALVAVLYFMWSSSVSFAKLIHPKGGAILASAEQSFAVSDGRMIYGNSSDAENFAKALAEQLNSKVATQQSGPLVPKIYCDFTSEHCAVFLDLPERAELNSSQRTQVTSSSFFASVGILKNLPIRPKNLAVVMHSGSYSDAMIGQLRGNASYIMLPSKPGNNAAEKMASLLEADGK